MAQNRQKVSQKRAKGNSEDTTYGNPRFPYCTTPGSLRKLLAMIPDKPKPPRIDGKTLKVWGLKNSNDRSILRVLKKLGLLTTSGDSTEYYAAFMKKDTGPASLGQRIKDVYQSLFENVTNPEKATNDELKSFFNIHAGGVEKTIRLQMETFKALADSATFSGLEPSGQAGAAGVDGLETRCSNAEGPRVSIDLHIHLPENKTKSDYDAIMESIANHLYKGRM